MRHASKPVKLQIWRWKIIDMKCRLVGARKFLEIAKPGTLFIPLEFGGYDSEEDRQELADAVKIFANNPISAYDANWGNLHIFVNNFGSVTFRYTPFIYDEDDDYIYYYDYNVVGDASPEYTLYLIVGSIEDIPSHINFFCRGDEVGKAEFDRDFVVYNDATEMYDHYLQLTEEEIKDRYGRVLKEICSVADIDNDWAKERLSKVENNMLDVDMVIEG